MTAKLKEINLPSLKERREQARMTLFRDIVTNASAVKIKSYIMKKTRNTRQNNNDLSSILNIHCRTESY